MPFSLFLPEDMRLSEMDPAAGKSRSFKKELTCKEIQKTLPKSVKRLSKQNSYLDDSTKEFSPRKRLKLSAGDTAGFAIETELPVDDCLNKVKQLESSESLDMSAASFSMKGTKPIQALLAKNIGNKVTLTSQLPPAASRSISAPEKLITSPMDSSPVKPVLPCQTSSKSPLQVLYKMPGGHCVPIDLHNNSVKIQMQPMADCKTGEKSPGEKIMQQVLILPKNFLIHHKEIKSVTKEIQPLQQKTTEPHHISLSQQAVVNTTLAPALSTSAISAATTFLPSRDFKKSATHLPQGANAVNRLPTLSSITSTGNVLASVVNMNQSETPKTKTVVSAASFPVASPTVSSAVQTLTVAIPRSVSACTSNSTPRLESPQKSSDVGEPKQELKTICIRDSQSILVRTRGGNTGIVKVQTNADQISPSTLSPSSVFTYAPQLQAFLVPKSTHLPTSSFSAGTTTMSNFPTLVQASTTSASNSAVSASVNQIMGKNMTLAFGQHSSGTVGLGTQKTVQVSSPTFLSPISSSNIVMPVPPNSSSNAISISPGNFGQSTIGATQTPFINQQGDVNISKYPTTQPENMTTSNGTVMSGAQIPKLMLVTNPPLLPACGTPGVNLIPAPTSTGITAQKLVFINTPLANIQPNTNLTAESFKQTFPPSVGKTYVKSTEQPQLVLIPSTVGSSIKVNASPTVSQIKDVKIGLNIGQAIINSTGNVQSVPPINLMQCAAPKNAEEKNSQNVTLPLPTSSGLIPVCSSLASQSIVSIKESLSVTTRTVNMSATMTTTTNAFLDSASVALSRTTAGTRPTVLAGGIDASTKITPIATTRLRTSNVGNTVAISTVKTGHLASSVLISTTQPTVSHQGLSPTFQLPVTVALPGPVNGTPKMMQAVPHLPTVPPTAQCALAKGQPSTLVQFQSPGISPTVPANGSVQKPQMVLPPNSSNAGKVVGFSNVVPLPCQPLPPNFVKPTPTFSSTLSVSTTPTIPASTSATSSVGGQLNESCIQQKIIINTCTPLAPGTQIMISGTRFIVPPQGLGAGSHVLLINSNPKVGPLLTVSNGHGFSRIPHASAAPQKTAQASSNALSWQPSKQPLKSSTKIVNSLGFANTLPIVHATPEIVNSVVNPCAPATTLSTSLITASPSTTLAKTSLVPATHIANSQLQDNASVLHLDTSIKKLMVSPEGAILNAINTPTSKMSSLSSSFSSDMVSTTTNPAAVFPTFLKSSISVPDTAAS